MAKNIDPTLVEMIDSLRDEYRLREGINNQGLEEETIAMQSDFDVAQAIYWFASDYHAGQSSNLYSVLSQSEYRPGPLENGADLDNEYYDILCESFAN